MNKKMILLALVCTVPTFMFGQVTKYEKGLEAAGKAATETGATIAEGITAGATKALQEVATSDASLIATATNGPIYTGMNVGTTAYMNMATPQLSSTTSLNLHRMRQNIEVGTYRAIERAKEFVLNNTVDLGKRREGNFLFTKQEMFAISDRAFYTYHVPSQYYQDAIKLSPKQRKAANEFYVNFLKRADAFGNFEKFLDSLGAVTGLAYTGDELTDRALVKFAMNAPEEYAFLTDLVVIPVLRLHGQTGMVRDLSHHRSAQEGWKEGSKGPTLPLYQTLKNYGPREYDNILPKNEDYSLSYPEILPGDLKPFSSIEEFNAFGAKNMVLWKIRQYAGNLYGWSESYPDLFIRKLWKDGECH